MGLDTSRVLRVGVVWRGQVVAERVLDRRIDITVGTRPDATVAVNPKDHPDFPSVLPLAVMYQNAYHIVLPTDPAHVINLRGGPSANQGLDKNAIVTVKGQKIVPVEQFTGGSLTLGDAILMFQFVRGDSVPTVTREETVLRIGLVHEDRLLSDQVFHAGVPTIIGVSGKSTIALPDNEYKGGDAVFRAAKGETAFTVNLPKGSDFRLALDGQPPVGGQEAVQKKVAAVSADGGWEMNLPLKARGRATLGPYTLLFQVVKQSVTVPVVARKGILAQLAGPILSDSTWSVSFLVALVLIGSIVGQAIIFHNTTGRFLAKQQTEEELQHTTFDVEIVEKEEPKEEEKKEVVDVRSDQAKKAADEKEKPDDKKKPTPADKPESIGKTADPDEIKRRNVEVVQRNTLAGAFGASTKLFGTAGEGEEGSVVAKTFGGGDGGGGDKEGSGPGSGGLKLDGGGGGGGTVEKFARTGPKGFGERGNVATKTEVKKEEAKVNIHLSAGDMGGDGEGKSDVAKVISRKNSAVQQCYERALRDNPEEGGKVKVSFTVGTAGTVTDVTVSGASGTFSDCIKNKFTAIRGLPLLASPQSFNQSYVFSKN